MKVSPDITLIVPEYQAGLFLNWLGDSFETDRDSGLLPRPDQASPQDIVTHMVRHVKLLAQIDPTQAKIAEN